MKVGLRSPLCLEGEISLSRFITAVSRFMFTQGYIREQHYKVSHAARRSYYAHQWLRSTDALDPMQFAALRKKRVQEINTGREMSCEKWSRLSTGKANSILCYLGVLPQMMSQRARSQKKIPPKPDTHLMTASFLSQGTSKHQLWHNAKIVRFCRKHSAKCAVFLLWFLFFHFFFSFSW